MKLTGRIDLDSFEFNCGLFLKNNVIQLNQFFRRSSVTSKQKVTIFEMVHSAKIL